MTSLEDVCLEHKRLHYWAFDFVVTAAGTGIFTALYNTKSGTTMAKAPMEYATVGPKHQNTEDATIGPMPLAKAPNDLKIPSAVPRSFILGTRDVAIEVKVGPQIADPIE